jgi:glycosyltransferase involved in cell wall biosynthesis
MTSAQTLPNQDLIDKVNLFWGSNSIRLVSAGRLVDVKNIDILVRSVALLAAELPVKLLILGDGPLKSSIHKLIVELHMEDVVMLAGFTGFPEYFFNIAHIFCLSSSSEGFPTVLLEALSCGMQVVSTNCRSGPSEILDNGNYGFLCFPRDVRSLANSIREAIVNPKSPDKIRLWLEQYSLPTIVDSYISILVRQP